MHPSIAADEWVGGHLTLPAYVEGEEPFRPEFVVWASRDRLLGATGAGPGDADGAALELLHTALIDHGKGKQRPRRLRVASPSLAAALTAEFGGMVRVVLAATPEIDAFVARFAESMNSGLLDRAAAAAGRDRPGPTYLGRGRIPEPAIAQFFRSAARLHRVAPWDIVPCDSDTLGIDIPAYGVKGLCASIIGQAGESFGFILFESVASFAKFLQREERGARGFGQRILSVDFAERVDVPDAMLREREAHGWTLASPNAIPVIMALDAEQVPVPLTEKDVTLVTACCEAIARFFDLHPHWDYSRQTERFEIDVVAQAPVVVITTMGVGDVDGTPPTRDEAGEARARPVLSHPVIPPKPGKPTTDVAVRRVIEELWGREFQRRYDDEIHAAIREFWNATRLTGDKEVKQAMAIAGSLPWIWAALWRPMHDGSFGLDKARRLSTTRAPVLAAAIGWLARARCTYVEVADAHPPSRRVWFRDLFDGTIYPLVVEASLARAITRHLRFFGPLVELGDGTWYYPSVLVGDVSLAGYSSARLIDDTRAALETAAIDPNEVDAAAPHAGLTRWAGFALGSVTAHVLAEKRKPPPMRYLVTSTGDRFELHSAQAKMPRAAMASLVAALTGAGDFLRDGPTSWSFVDTGLTTVHAQGETIGKVEVEGGVLRVGASSEARYETLRRRLEELAGVSLKMGKHTVIEPWKGTPGFVEREGDGVERAVMAQSVPLEEPTEVGVGAITIEHLRRQIDVHIPMLGGRPRELVATAEGRGKIDGWLREAELRGLPGEGGAKYLDLDDVRRELGLAAVGGRRG